MSEEVSKSSLASEAETEASDGMIFRSSDVMDGGCSGASAFKCEGEMASNHSEAMEASGVSKSGALEEDLNGSSDEVPENRRCARIVLISIFVLILFTLATVILVPPLSWTPQKGMKSEFHTVSEVGNVQQGASPSAELRYSAFLSEGLVRSELKYGIHLEQTTKYEGDAQVRAEMDASILIRKPANCEREDEIEVYLEGVELHLFDGGNEVSLASTSAMIEGISIRSRLESKGGMSSILPPATKINPQTARILFIISDALRQIFPPLPDEKVGEDARWELRDLCENREGFIRKGKVRATGLTSEDVQLRTEFLLFDAQNRASEIGSGVILSKMRRGDVEESDIYYSRKQSAYEGGASVQETRMKFVLEKEQ